MDEELIDEIDWDDNVIATHSKNVWKKRMYPHRVSLIIPRTFNNKFILSRRAKEQEPWPDTWVCAVGGKTISGETKEEAALREMKEEVGMSCDLEFISNIKYSDDNYKAIFHIFTTKKPVNVELLKPNPKEIQYFKEFTLDEIKEEISKNPTHFAGTFISAIKEFTKNIDKKQ